MTVSPGTVVTDLERTLQPDDTTAAPALQGGPNRNLPVADTAPSMSHAEAVSRRDTLISDAAFRERCCRGVGWN